MRRILLACTLAIAGCASPGSSPLDPIIIREILRNRTQPPVYTSPPQQRRLNCNVVHFGNLQQLNCW